MSSQTQNSQKPILYGLVPMPNNPYYLKLGRNECPICEKVGKACGVHIDGNVVTCMNVYSSEPSSWGMGGYKHRLDNKDGHGGYEIIKNKKRQCTDNLMGPVEVRDPLNKWIKKKYKARPEDIEYIQNTRKLKDTSRYCYFPKPVSYTHLTLPTIYSV